MERPAILVYLLLTIRLAAWSAVKAESTPPAITVYTQFEKASSAVSVRAMRGELESIMIPLGLEFSWRDLPDSRGVEVSVELVVVSFKGACRMSESLPGRTETGALGWTYMSDGVILPFSDVDCDK